MNFPVAAARCGAATIARAGWPRSHLRSKKALLRDLSLHDGPPGVKCPIIRSAATRPGAECPICLIGAQSAPGAKRPILTSAATPPGVDPGGKLLPIWAFTAAGPWHRRRAIRTVELLHEIAATAIQRLRGAAPARRVHCRHLALLARRACRRTGSEHPTPSQDAQTNHRSR